MAKFYGEIGYGKTAETKPGIWKTTITEKKYIGEYTSYSKRWQDGDKVNGDIRIRADISIVADPDLYNNYGTIRYVKIHGTPWEVESITPQYPRLFISLGGLYNGELAGTENPGNGSSGASSETP